MRVCRQQLPVSGQLDAVSATTKERLADDFFQPQHLLTDSRLCLVDGHSGLSDTPVFHKSQKRAQKTHFHIVGFPLCAHRMCLRKSRASTSTTGPKIPTSSTWNIEREA